MQTQPTRIEDWIKSPINSAIGTIWLGGYLRNKNSISREKMRILGRYAIVLILDGQVYYEDELGTQAVLQRGDVIMVTPELAHAYGSHDGRAWSQSYVVFDGPQFDLLQQSESIRTRQPIWNLDSIDHWYNRLKTILHRPTDTAPSHGIRILGHFLHLLIEMVTAERPKDPEKDDWLMESIRLLGEPQETGWSSPQKVATQVGLSYENFRKLFTQQTGHPPRKFQRQRKIDQACAAIYRGATNFKELAEDLDFCDVYHFSKSFRQHKGMPPSAYRRTVRGI